MSETLPLGLKPEAQVSPSDLEVLRDIEGLDLEHEARGAKESGAIDDGEQMEVQLAMKRFFALVYLVRGATPVELGPSAKVDAIWHNFILDTPRYVSFSEEVYGSYLHHRPKDDSTDDYKSRHPYWWSELVGTFTGHDLVQEYFVDPVLEYWPAPESGSPPACYAACNR